MTSPKSPTRFALWKLDRPLVLASASPIRLELLVDAGLWTEARPASIDERAVEARLGRMAPQDIARGLAEAKAVSVSGQMPGRLVLGADQTLALDGERFHKPHDRTDARRHLVSLSGRTHHLHAGLALAQDGAALWSHVESAALSARLLTPAFIEAYLDSAGDAVLSSVGAYQLEALGAHLFDRIEGEHTTILGLPLQPLLRELRQRGCIAA